MLLAWGSKRGEKMIIGKRLINAGVINPSQLEEALAIQENTREKLGMILIGCGYISREILMRFLTEQTNQAIHKANSTINDITVPESI